MTTIPEVGQTRMNRLLSRSQWITCIFLVFLLLSKLGYSSELADLEDYLCNYQPLILEDVSSNVPVQFIESKALQEDFSKTQLEPNPNSIVEHLQNCKRFISSKTLLIHECQGSSLALTAQLCIGLAFGQCQLCFYHKKKVWERLVQIALKIFNRLSKKFPETWQGKYASTFSRELFLSTVDLSSVKKKCERRIRVYSGNIPALKELDSNTEFQEFWGKFLGIKDFAYVTAYEAVIYNQLELGEIAKAKATFVELKSNRGVPETTVNRIASQIKAFTDYSK